jgi:hypothetical protein
MPNTVNKTVIGWREWVGLPDLGIDNIKAKIDTGARTSSLDASEVVLFEKEGRTMVRFQATSGRRDNTKQQTCTAAVVENRNVTNSGGYVEERIVISTKIRIGDLEKKIEITLTQRDNMKFRMLLGRTALGNDFQVDVGRSYLTRSRLKRTGKASVFPPKFP